MSVPMQTEPEPTLPERKDLSALIWGRLGVGFRKCIWWGRLAQVQFQGVH